MKLDFNDAFAAWGAWEKDAKEKEEERDQAQGMMITLARFAIMALVPGVTDQKKTWPAKDVEAIANQKPE